MASLFDSLRHLTEDSQRQTRTLRSVVEATGQLMTVVLGLVAAITLIGEHGFYLDEDLKQLVDQGHVLVLYGFTILVIGRALASSSPIRFLRSHKADTVIVVLVLFLILAPGVVANLLYTINPYLTARDVSASYIALTQVFLLVAFIPAALRASQRFMSRNLHPATMLVASFAGLVIIGALLLLLPKATTKELSIVDAIFTSTSAVCVTGLTVVDTASRFTPLGQLILLMLIQIGGLGIMTLTTILGLLIGGVGGLKEYATLQTYLGEESLGRIRRTLWTVTLVTLTFEAVGAVALWQSVDPSVAGTGSRGIFFAVFHSVSAFCNAGFALTTEGLTHPLLRMNGGVLGTVMVLVIVGGIGFPVLTNIGQMMRPRGSYGRPRLTLQTKLVLLTSSVLLIIGTVAFAVLESGPGWEEKAIGERWWTAAFHSIIARTAGFNTVDIGSLSLPGLFILILLMWVGGSPASTAGGVKTTSVALAVLNIRAIVTAAPRVEAFRTTIAADSIVRAFSTILLSFVVISVLVFTLLLLDEVAFDAALFEVVSAVSTVGLSTGITPLLSDGGKLTIITGMFVGRVGVLSFVVAITGRSRRRFGEYPAENVLVT